MATPTISAFSLLGGDGVLMSHPRVNMDWIPLVRQGLPAASVDSILKLTRMAQTELTKALAISERTFARRKREGVFSPEESAKLVRFARIVERAEEVFEDAAQALAWLRRENPALGGVCNGLIISEGKIAYNEPSRREYDDPTNQ